MVSLGAIPLVTCFIYCASPPKVSTSASSEVPQTAGMDGSGGTSRERPPGPTRDGGLHRTDGDATWRRTLGVQKSPDSSSEGLGLPSQLGLVSSDLGQASQPLLASDSCPKTEAMVCVLTA